MTLWFEGCANLLEYILKQIDEPFVSLLSFFEICHFDSLLFSFDSVNFCNERLERLLEHHRKQVACLVRLKWIWGLSNVNFWSFKAFLNQFMIDMVLFAVYFELLLPKITSILLISRPNPCFFSC